MKTIRVFNVTAMIALAGVCTIATASESNARHYTAAIDGRGEVLAQSPEWISAVKHHAQQSQMATYEIEYKAGAFTGPPSFCTVSLTDTRDTDDLYYGNARLGGTPQPTHLTVVTQLSGADAPTGDGSQPFMLLCLR